MFTHLLEKLRTLILAIYIKILWETLFIPKILKLHSKFQYKLIDTKKMFRKKTVTNNFVTGKKMKKGVVLIFLQVQIRKYISVSKTFRHLFERHI